MSVDWRRWRRRSFLPSSRSGGIPPTRVTTSAVEKLKESPRDFVERATTEEKWHLGVLLGVATITVGVAVTLLFRGRRKGDVDRADTSGSNSSKGKTEIRNGQDVEDQDPILRRALLSLQVQMALKALLQLPVVPSMSNLKHPSLKLPCLQKFLLLLLLLLLLHHRLVLHHPKFCAQLQPLPPNPTWNRIHPR